MKKIHIEIHHENFLYIGYLLRAMFPDAIIESNPPSVISRPVIVSIQGHDDQVDDQDIVIYALHDLVRYTEKDEYRNLPQTCETLEFILFSIMDGL